MGGFVLVLVLEQVEDIEDDGESEFFTRTVSASILRPPKPLPDSRSCDSVRRVKSGDQVRPQLPATKEPQFDFDVFISYSSKDKDWVRGELLQRIEQTGLKAFIDFRDFTCGAPSINECERGVVQCGKTLLVLTPNYIESGWTEIENIMVQTLDPANRSLRLIPLLKAECKRPLRIGALTHIDFTDGADHDLAWRQLLTALGKRPKPSRPRNRPATAGSSRIPTRCRPTSPGASPSARCSTAGWTRTPRIRC